MSNQTLQFTMEPMSQAIGRQRVSTNRLTALDPDTKTPQVADFEAELRARVIGQEGALSQLGSLYQVFKSGLASPNRPIGTMLFLGPTGSGKTHVVEAAAAALFGDSKAVVKIDCAEFQHSHEIAKLVGSPPGYLGHRETAPLLTQENLDKYHSEDDPFTLVLFDEIEKASDALWQLLLGILDKATLTLGDNRKVDFSQTMIFMTSNLGADEMSRLINGAIGFAPANGGQLAADELDQKIYHTATEAARRKFSPEFMNRIDKTVVFRGLKQEELRRVIDLEIDAVQGRIEEGVAEPFSVTVTDAAKEFLLAEGTDYRYGARHLKRAIERFMVCPLANLASSKQLRLGDIVVIDMDSSEKKLAFFRDDHETHRAAAALLAARSMAATQIDSLAA